MKAEISIEIRRKLEVIGNYDDVLIKLSLGQEHEHVIVMIDFPKKIWPRPLFFRVPISLRKARLVLYRSEWLLVNADHSNVNKMDAWKEGNKNPDDHLVVGNAYLNM